MENYSKNLSTVDFAVPPPVIVVENEKNRNPRNVASMYVFLCFVIFIIKMTGRSCLARTNWLVLLRK